MRSIRRNTFFTYILLLCLLVIYILTLVCCTPDSDIREPGDTEPSTAAEVSPSSELEGTPDGEPAYSVADKPVTEPQPETAVPSASPALTTSVATVPTGASSEPDTDPGTETYTLPETAPVTVPEPDTEPLPEPIVIEDWKAMWLSQFDLMNVYTHGGRQRNREDFTSLIGQMLDNVCADGFNTVIVQVRPYGDSMYPSALYPPSSYVTGSYYKEFDYDPFAIILAEAKERGLAVHAWINPLRAMETEDMIKVYDDYVIRRWYDDPDLQGKYVVEVDGRIYLNPAYGEVRRLIADGVAEILDRYAVDGIHMDDYFYPTTDASFDAAAYSDYLTSLDTEESALDLMSWRRTNLDLLVSELYRTVKAHDPLALFGISPSGVIDTVYNEHCADVYRWCSEDGYLDYICPQVYFGMEHQTCDFVSVCDTWQSIVQSDRVTLLIGMGVVKAYDKEDIWAGTGRYEWAEHSDILSRCLAHTLTLEKCAGVSVFSYQYYYDPVTGTDVPETAIERNTFTPLLCAITWRREE